MRDLNVVIDAMKSHIPESKKELIAALNKVQYNMGFSAPELHKRFWFDTAEALARYISDPQADWEIKVANIFNGVSPVAN